MPRGRLFRFAAIGAGVAVVIAVALAAFLSMRTSSFQPALPGSGVASAPCSPKPCANVRGFSLWVTDIKVDSNLVAMKVRFKNSSSATHVDPADLRLVDSQNQVVAPVHDAPGCAAWGRYEFVRTKTFGPVAECFRPSTTSAPLKLRWSPDFGFLCCDLDIVLTTLGT